MTPDEAKLLRNLNSRKACLVLQLKQARIKGEQDNIVAIQEEYAKIEGNIVQLINAVCSRENCTVITSRPLD